MSDPIESAPFKSIENASAQATIRFRHLSDAFKVASSQQLTWIAILIVTVLLSSCASLALTIIGQILVFVFGVPLAAANAPDLVFDVAAFVTAGLVWLGGLAVFAFLEGGWFFTACKQVRGEVITVGDLFGGGRFLGQLFLVTLVPTLLMWGIGLLVGISAAVFVWLFSFQLTPHVYWLLVTLTFVLVAVLWGRLMLAIPLVVNGRQTAVSALGNSWSALQGQTAKAAVFHFLAVVLSLLGGVLCGIGVIFTLPIYNVAIALVYRDYFPTSVKAADLSSGT